VLIVNDLGLSFCVRIESHIVSASFCASKDMLIGVYFSPDTRFLVGRGGGGGFLIILSGLITSKDCCFGGDFRKSPAIALRFSTNDLVVTSPLSLTRDFGEVAGLGFILGFVGGFGFSGDVLFELALGGVLVVILVFSNSLGLSLFILTGGGEQILFPDGFSEVVLNCVGTGLGFEKFGFGGLGFGGVDFRRFGGLGLGGRLSNFELDLVSCKLNSSRNVLLFRLVKGLLFLGVIGLGKNCELERTSVFSSSRPSIKFCKSARASSKFSISSLGMSFCL